MAKKEEVERLPRPELPALINIPEGAGKIRVIVSGRLKYTCSDNRVIIERK